MKTAAILAVSLLLLLHPFPSAGADESARPSARYALTLPHGQIKATWQKTGIAEADRLAESKVLEDAERFKAQVEELAGEMKDMGMPMPQCELKITAAASPGGKTMGVLWAVYEYLGGAHGSLALESRIYHEKRMQDGKRVLRVLKLGDLFRSPAEAIRAFSEYSRDELLKRGLDPSMVEPGTAPSAENFNVFLLSNDGIVLFFEPYQVAPWADGTIRLTVPLARLKNAGPVMAYWK